MRKILYILIIVLVCATLVGFSPTESKYTIYKIGNNNITKEVKESEIHLYVNSAGEWSTEPTTLMYTADGRTAWISNREVEAYSKVSWSIYPPLIIYSVQGERTILVEELKYYLSTGVWYTSKEEVPQKKKTMNVFERTNIPASELEKMLTKGLQGYGQVFFDMEQKYGVNSVFAISVAELESGNGTSSAFKNKNNAFGIGPGRYFNSVQSGIEYFYQLMNNSLYYEKSIDKIGSIYCVGGNWASKIKSLMNNNYSVLS